MNKTNDFKYNLPAYSDPVDIEDLNDNFRGIDDALMAGLCKKDYTGNNMGSSDPSARKYAWAPWLEIVNDNEFDVVVTDRNAPVGSEEATINIAACQTFRKYINGRYYMNFYVQDQHDVTFKWFTNAETYINESGGGGGGTGTVTSVSVQGGSGSHLTGSGNPIETSGTITINVDEGYSIPSDNEQTAWDSKAADLKAEIDSSTYVLTLQLKDSSGNLIGNERTIDLPLETMVVDGEYDPQTKKIKLELKNGNYVEFSVADLVSGLQSELSASNKLDPAYIDYDASHRAVSDTEKGTWNAKQNAISDLETIRSGASAGATAVQPSALATALAGKQDSLSTEQLAAANSGINSTKVAQIETNKSNILYALETGVKNLIVMTEASFSGYGLTINRTPQGLTISGTATESFELSLSDPNYIYSQKSEPTYTKLPTNVKLTGAPDNVQKNRIIVALYNGSTWAYSFSSLSAMPQDLSAYTYDNWYAYIPIVSGTSYSGTWYPMLQDASISDDTFVPGALPNYDLTRLEAEDRASLAEVVDSGAKNKLQYDLASLKAKNTDGTWNNNAYTVGGITYTLNSDMSISISGTRSSEGAAIFNLADYTAVSGDLLSQGTTGTYNVFLYARGGSSSCNGDGYTSIASTDIGVNRTYALAVTAAGLAVNQRYYPMICTKAAFGVSPKFVPYRLPNNNLGYKTYEINLSAVTINKAGSGVYWYKISVSSDFSKVVSVSLSDGKEIPNKRSFMPYIENGTGGAQAIGFLIADPDAPATMTFNNGAYMSLTAFGYLK